MSQRTIEDGPNQNTSEIRLLSKIEPVGDLRSVRVVGPGRTPVASHDSDVYVWREGFRGRDGWKGDPEGREKPRRVMGRSERGRTGYK